jgi:ribonuclease HI
MAKQKFYVVWVGRKPGIYNNWDECKAQVNGFSGAKFKSFKTQRLADDAFVEGDPDHNSPTENHIPQEGNWGDVPWETDDLGNAFI